MQKIRLFFIGLLNMLLLVSCSNQPAKVHLSGNLKHFTSKTKLEPYEPIAKIKGESVLFEVDSLGNFEVEFDLNKPSYFRLGRNFLYLYPGQNLVVDCDYYSGKLGKFSGDGWEMNQYLTHKYFPKSGAYLETGAIFKDYPVDFDIIKNRLYEIEKECLDRLNSTQNITQQFKEIEENRIYLATACSFKMYNSYSFSARKDKEISNDEFWRENQPLMDKEIDRCLNKLKLTDECIQIEELYSLYKPLKEKNLLTSDMIDFANIKGLLYHLTALGPNHDFFDKREKHDIKNETYNELLNGVLSEYEDLFPGKPAPYLSFADQNNKEFNLENFKGKLLLIDIWATWCGPCCGEIPAYEKLWEEYKNKDINFISISVDENKGKWLNFLQKHDHNIPQYRTERANFEKYHVGGIPRFLLLDKNNCFIDAWAARPSNPDLVKLIDENLK